MANGRNPGKARGRRHVGTLKPGEFIGMSFESNATAALKELQEQMVEMVLRPAAYAGAKIFYDEMMLRAPFKSGELKDAIYHWFDVKSSSAYKKTYLIGPNKVKAPHWFNVENGHWRYNRSGGTHWLRSKSNRNTKNPTPGVLDPSIHNLPGALDVPQWVPASPYIRPTWDSKKGAAGNAVKARFAERMSQVFGSI